MSKQQFPKVLQVNSTIKAFTLFMLFFCTCFVYSQTASWHSFAPPASTGNKPTNDNELIQSFLKSKGYGDTILFNSSNVKQFWTDSSVACLDGQIKITLKPASNNIFQSVPLKIQFIGVNETQDCSITVISDDSDFDISVLNDKSAVISTQPQKEIFIQYHVVSTTFHFDDTKDFSFNMKFSSKTTQILSIKSIVLSFSDNKATRYPGSPGFDQLSREIEENGTRVAFINDSLSEYSIQYLIRKENNKIFIRIPTKIAETYRYYYHTYPVDLSNITPERAALKYVFNNFDFSFSNSKYLAIPKPYNSKSEYTIIQKDLPTHKCSKINIGQFDTKTGEKFWYLELKDFSPN